MADLSVGLRKLCSEAKKIVNEYVKAGKVKKLKRMYVSYKIEKFEYKKGGGISSQGSYPYIEKEEWDWREIFNLIDVIKKELPSYTKGCKTISKNYKVSESQAESWLSRFIQTFVRETLNERVGDETITDLIVTFIGDLEGNPRQWRLKTWLDGVWMELDEIQIDEGIKVRKPQPADLEFEYPLDIPFFMRTRQTFRHPSAILEINKRVKIRPYVYDELEKIILTLRLYKTGSVFRTRIEWQPKSILSFGGETGRDIAWASSYKYPITKSDLDILPAFMEKIKPLMPTDDSGRLIMSEHTGIALQRYGDTLLKPEPIENKLAYCIMGLEALYLKRVERAELSHKLAQRVAMILGFFGQSPVKAYNVLKKAYEIRSDFVHGSPLRTEEPRKIKALLDEVLEYLRLSLLIFLQLKGKVEKERILALIDNAMLEKQAFEKLEKLLASTRISSVL